MDVLQNILVTPGSQPETDFTKASTPHYVVTDKVRFVDGFPEKIGGWQSLVFNDDIKVKGACRSIYSYNLERSVRYLFGTNTSLYYRIGSFLENLTPLDTTTQAIPNSLETLYGTLANDPITTTLGSNELIFADTGTRIRVGDTIEVSGATGFNGIPAGEINTQLFVREQSANTFTVVVSSNATASGSGGGGAVNRASAIIRVTKASHDIQDGSRVKITGSTAIGGIPASSVNSEFITRNSFINTFDVVSDTIATSSVTGAGGAGVEIQEQIEAGLSDSSSAQGYGAGLYGTGLYGTALVSNGGAIPVRKWSFDRFGNNVLSTPGAQTGLYTWDSDTAEAPVLLANAPTEINYVFVSNEIAVTLGASGVVNRLQWSDQGNSTVWTGAAENQAGQDDIEGASAFISHINVKGVNLIFTDSQVYTFRYIGRPFVWETKLLDEKSGIISQNARVQHNGIAYWMGTDNFYFYRSGNVQIIPSNTTNETTLKKYVFDDLNLSQISKTFAWFNRKFNEVWWHYPSADSNEPNRIVRYNVKDRTWVYDNFERSAGEYPTQLLEFPLVAMRNNGDSTIYQHEIGNDADGDPLSFTLKTNLQVPDSGTTNFLGLAPDSIQTGSITCNVDTFKYPQSSQVYDSVSLPIDPTTEFLSFRVNSRYVQYTITGSELGQSWRAGRWQVLLSKGGKR